MRANHPARQLTLFDQAEDEAARDLQQVRGLADGELVIERHDGHGKVLRQVDQDRAEHVEHLLIESDAHAGGLVDEGEAGSGQNAELVDGILSQGHGGRRRRDRLVVVAG